MAPIMPALSRQQLDWLILLCVNIPIPVMLGWKTYSGELTAKVAIICALAILLIMNSVVVVGIKSRRKRHGIATPRSFIFWAVGLAVFSAMVTTLTVASIPVRNDYRELALSNTPLSDIQPEQRRLVVELIRHRAESSREQNRFLAQVKPLSPALYSPESFASVGVIQNTSSTMKKIAEMDFEYTAKNQQSMAEFREKMATADPGYLKAWDAERQGQEKLEASTLTLEKQWLAGVEALYEFAAKHTKSISLRGNKLEFSSPAVEQDFRRQKDTSEALYNKLMEQVRTLAERQQKAQGKTGGAVPQL
jgi:hypothetical protein